MRQKDLILYLHGSAAFQLLNAGIELEIFDFLNKGPQIIEALAREAKLESEAVRSLIFGLVALGLIKKSAGKYRNSPIIDLLFKRREWEMFKSMVKLQAKIMYPGQVDYLESLKKNTNVGVKRFRGKGKTIYERLAFDSELARMFYDYMEKYSDYARPHLLKHLNLSKANTLLDVGGGAGNNAIALVKNFPNLEVTILDLPIALGFARKKIKKRELGQRVRFRPGNIFKDNFPKNYDAVLFMHQLVIWSKEQNESLLRKAYKSLRGGGRVVIFSSISDDNERGPLMAALDSVYFRAVAAGRGMIYPWKDYAAMLKKAGFKRIEKIRCKTWTPHGIIIGYK